MKETHTNKLVAHSKKEGLITRTSSSKAIESKVKEKKIIEEERMPNFNKNSDKEVIKFSKIMPKKFYASFDKEGIKIYRNDCMKFLDSLPEESVDIIVTDPAYSGMNQKMKFGKGRIVGNYGVQNNGKWFKEFHDTEENYNHFLDKCKRVLKPNGVIYIMLDSFSLLTLGKIFRTQFNVKNIIIWDKINMGMGHNFRRRHEFIVYMTKNKSKLNARNFPDIWRIKRVHRAPYPTQKPTEIFEIMLAASAKPGDVVCDPFMGSSSAAIAAINKGCRFLGADISENACEMSKKRIFEYINTNKDIYQKKSLVPEDEKRLF